LFKAIGGWLMLDGIGSILLYYKAPDYNGKLQTWRRDHWMRVARALFGLALIIWSD
jgi:hypothetical protein